MKCVILESPYAGNVPLHLRYLRACMRDCLLRFETPYASHHLYTAPGVLRDEVPEERELGINAGFAWRPYAALTVFYTDLGLSGGMVRALEVCRIKMLPYEQRFLGEGWFDRHRTLERAGAALYDWRRE